MTCSSEENAVNAREAMMRDREIAADGAWWEWAWAMGDTGVSTIGGGAATIAAVIGDGISLGTLTIPAGGVIVGAATNEMRSLGRLSKAWVASSTADERAEAAEAAYNAALEAYNECMEACRNARRGGN